MAWLEPFDIDRQHIEQVLRQMIGRQLGAVAEIAIQHDDIALAAAARRRGAGRPAARCGPRGTTETLPCGRNWHASRTSAGAPMRVERVLLVLRRRRAMLRPGRHPDPAGRASRPPAAHRRMRQMEAAARLQHRPAARNADGPAGIATSMSPLRRRSIRLRISRATNAATMMEKYQLSRLSFHCAIASRCAALVGAEEFERRRHRGRGSPQARAPWR